MFPTPFAIRSLYRGFIAPLILTLILLANVGNLTLLLLELFSKGVLFRFFTLMLLNIKASLTPLNLLTLTYLKPI